MAKAGSPVRYRIFCNEVSFLFFTAQVVTKVRGESIKVDIDKCTILIVY